MAKIAKHNSWDTIPQSLKSHMAQQIQELLTVPWFKTAKDYFTNPPQIHILSIETKDVELLNILGELRDYINGMIDNPSTSYTETGQTKSAKDLHKISGILAKIDTKRVTKAQRRALRKYIEISPLGREILKTFYNKIIADGKISAEMELIFNPYTSLVNLAEIYSQCTEYSKVRYSVPELGIQEAQIYLYYPESKREEYLAYQPSIGQQIPWLMDALRRICFFNRLLKTKKQPRAIHVFLADFRKEFMHVSGKADLVFTPSEINTGVCDMTDIIITRSEESLKTLFHELIHFHSLDFKHAVHDEFCTGLFNITTEQSSFNLFEAHTECLASILHCLYSVVIPFRQQSDKDFQRKFRQLFTAQIYYTMRKAAQILATSGCDSYAEFITPTDREKCQLRENTNVFSYFFVKAFIYLGLRDWFTGCCDSRTARFIDSVNTKQILHRVKGGQDTGNTGLLSQSAATAVSLNSRPPSVGLELSGNGMLKFIIQKGYQNRILHKIIDDEIKKSHIIGTSPSDKSLRMVVN